MPTRLVTYADVTTDYKHISANISSSKFDMYVLEAQELDLRPLLRTELYVDLLEDFEASPSLVTYDDLMNGSTYEYNGKTYKQEGLIPVLAYFTYARYLEDAGINSTQFGVVEKNNPYSQPTSDKKIAARIAQARSAALAYWERVDLFLRQHRDDYPLYKCDIKHRTAQGLTIRAVGGNSSHKFKQR